MRFLDEVRDELQGYLDRPRWWQARAGTSALRSVAYFSPEFGIAEALPQYSGGLGRPRRRPLEGGVRPRRCPSTASASSTATATSARPCPSTGGSRSATPTSTRTRWRSRRATTSGSRSTSPGTPLVAQVWRADVGRVPLYLLDADVEENPDEVRSRHRPPVRRRPRAPHPPGDPPRDRRRAGAAGARHRRAGLPHQRGPRRVPRPRAHPPVRSSSDGLTYAEAIEATRAGSIFTTHTPVPAGIDRFPRELMEKYFAGWAKECGLTVDDLMALGHRPGDPPEERFNMAVMGLRLAGRSNAVSKLHGEGVSRDVRRPVAGRARRRGADHVDHQRRAREHVGVAGDVRRPQPLRAAGVGRGRRRPLGAHRRRGRRRDLAGAGAGPRAPRARSCAAG